MDFERFTSKLILAFGLFEVMDIEHAKERERLKFIEENTHEDIRIALYKLDRCINPNKKDFDPVDHKFKFLVSIPGEFQDKELTLSEQQIQNYLCLAIREVHQIVLKAMKDYKIEIGMLVGQTTADDYKDYFKGTVIK
jgi:hypothetical protein